MLGMLDPARANGRDVAVHRLPKLAVGVTVLMLVYTLRKAPFFQVADRVLGRCTHPVLGGVALSFGAASLAAQEEPSLDEGAFRD